MTAFLKPVGLIFALLAVIAVLIVIPYTLLGVVGNWRVVFLSISYFIFFLRTVWRVVRYGQLANRQENRQIQGISGRIASIITVIRLLGIHWLSLYTFSLQDQTLNPTINQGLMERVGSDFRYSA